MILDGFLASVLLLGPAGQVPPPTADPGPDLAALEAEIDAAEAAFTAAEEAHQAARSAERTAAVAVREAGDRLACALDAFEDACGHPLGDPS